MNFQLNYLKTGIISFMHHKKNYYSYFCLKSSFELLSHIKILLLVPARLKAQQNPAYQATKNMNLKRLDRKVKSLNCNNYFKIKYLPLIKCSSVNTLHFIIYIILKKPTIIHLYSIQQDLKSKNSSKFFPKQKLTQTRDEFSRE